MILFWLVLVLFICLVSIFQIYIPPLIWLKEAPILLHPAFLFYGCLTLPFAQTLSLIFLTGLLNDVLTVPFAQESNFNIGTSILLYLVPGLILHGLRPVFLQGRWFTGFLLALLAAILTPLPSLGQYAIISFERRSFFYNDVIMWRILGPGVIAIVITPCVFLILSYLAGLVRYQPKLERLA
jgi:hypothetical protein